MCNKTCEKEKTCCNEINTSKCNNSYDYLIIVVLYILLVIILAACLL